MIVIHHASAQFPERICRDLRFRVRDGYIDALLKWQKNSSVSRFRALKKAARTQKMARRS
jgi:hypothetical protein